MSLQFDHFLNSPEFGQNPYPLYEQLRAKAPIYWSEAWGCWLLTRYNDVVETLRDHRRFSSMGRLTSVMEQALPEPLLEQLQPLIRHYSTGLINVDPPDHTRLRVLVHKAFSPRVIERLRSHVQDIVNELLDRVEGARRMDVVQDLAYLLPVTVIAGMMGVPKEDRDKFKFWSGKIVEFMATPRPAPQVMLSSQAALLSLREYFRDIFANRRQEPQEDLISALVAVEEAGDKLTEEELLSTCVTILIGGHETTTNLIASGLLALLQHPAQLEKLKNKPDLIGPAVEEFLRYEGPFQRNRRIAAENVLLDGHQIKKGDLVVQFLGAANRDPAQFAHPDLLDIERSPNRHVAFGYGVHFCLGAALARLEAPIAINTTLHRWPNLRLAGDTLEWQNTVFRGLKALPVTF